MANVTYGGRDDIRILGREDLAKAGVEIEANLVFYAGEATEVTDEVAKALTENTELFGAFEIQGEPEVVEAEIEKAGEMPVEDPAPATNKRSSKS